MLERFTERARRVVVLATEEARSRRHGLVQPEHLLMGILRDGGALDVKVLERIRVNPETLRTEVERVLSETPESATGGDPAFSPELKAVLEAAFGVHRRRHGLIGTEHLLLGLLADERSAASRILRAAGEGLTVALRMGFLGDLGLPRREENVRFIATSKWRVQT
jgi:ATP-dependent Clp protease ATP-binding subunit ClpC